MYEQIDEILSLNRDPMVAAKGRKIILYNTAAKAHFPQLTKGRICYGVIPEHMLREDADTLYTASVINGKKYSVSSTRRGALTLYTFFPLENKVEESAFVNYSIINTLLSSIFNTGLAIEKLTPQIDTTGDPKTKQYLAILYHNYYIMRRTLGNLNLSNLLMADKLDHNTRTVNVSKLCSGLADALQPLLEDKGIKFSYLQQKQDIYAKVDREKLEIVILNLIANSCLNTKAGGKIELSLDEEDTNILICVSDTGKGMSREAALSAFHRCEQTNPFEPTLSPGGAKLGLYISKGIVDLHKGSIILDTVENGGTRICVRLPIGSDGKGTFREEDVIDYAPKTSVLFTELAELLDSNYYKDKYLD